MEPNEPDESRLLACVAWNQAVDRMERPRVRYLQWSDVPDSLQGMALEAFRRKYHREPRVTEQWARMVEADTSRLLAIAVHFQRDAVDLSLPTWQATWDAVPPELQSRAVVDFRRKFHRDPHL